MRTHVSNLFSLLSSDTRLKRGSLFRQYPLFQGIASLGEFSRRIFQKPIVDA